jgi:hypothetical protein
MDVCVHWLKLDQPALVEPEDCGERLIDAPQILVAQPSDSFAKPLHVDRTELLSLQHVSPRCAERLHYRRDGPHLGSIFLVGFECGYLSSKSGTVAQFVR